MRKRRIVKSSKARHGHGKIISLPVGYEADLEKLVDMIYDEAYKKDWGWGELAREAKLSHYTVWRLGLRITKFPRMDTIWKLAKATGFRVGLSATRAGAPSAIEYTNVKVQA